MLNTVLLGQILLFPSFAHFTKGGIRHHIHRDSLIQQNETEQNSTGKDNTTFIGGLDLWPGSNKNTPSDIFKDKPSKENTKEEKDVQDTNEQVDIAISYSDSMGKISKLKGPTLSLIQCKDNCFRKEINNLNNNRKSTDADQIPKSSKQKSNYTDPNLSTSNSSVLSNIQCKKLCVSKENESNISSNSATIYLSVNLLIMTSLVN